MVGASEVYRADLPRVRTQSLERIRYGGVIGSLRGLDRPLQHVDEIVLRSLDSREENGARNVRELLEAGCVIYHVRSGGLLRSEREGAVHDQECVVQDLRANLRY